jgi:hypothetical protein
VVVVVMGPRMRVAGPADPSNEFCSHCPTLARIRPSHRKPLQRWPVSPVLTACGSSYGHRARFRCVRSRFPIGRGPKQAATAPDQWLRECECLRSARAPLASPVVVVPDGRPLRGSHSLVGPRALPASGRYAHLCEEVSVVDVRLLSRGRVLYQLSSEVEADGDKRRPHPGKSPTVLSRQDRTRACGSSILTMKHASPPHSTVRSATARR